MLLPPRQRRGERAIWQRLPAPAVRGQLSPQVIQVRLGGARFALYGPNPVVQLIPLAGGVVEAHELGAKAEAPA